MMFNNNFIKIGIFLIIIIGFLEFSNFTFHTIEGKTNRYKADNEKIIDYAREANIRQSQLDSSLICCNNRSYAPTVKCVKQLDQSTCIIPNSDGTCSGAKYTNGQDPELSSLKTGNKLEACKIPLTNGTYLLNEDVKETTMMSGKPEKKNIYQVRKDMQKSVKDANQKLKDAEQRKKDRLKKMASMKESLLPLIEEFGVELISEILGSLGARTPEAGKDSAGIRKAQGKDDGGSSDSDSSGMDNKEKVGYNALLQIAKKLNKAYNDEATANSDEAEERAIDQVYKYRDQFKSKAKFYKDSTVAKARADAKKAIPPKERDFG